MVLVVECLQKTPERNRSSVFKKYVFGYCEVIALSSKPRCSTFPIGRASPRDGLLIDIGVKAACQRECADGER